ncbi:MAG TPA: TetR/AcrR family transcriptional regulator [Candidatus Angelobacter sp.]|nr:TetR/AcrR family transcriptional regulator [Candidatus Angelobacter sp.]
MHSISKAGRTGSRGEPEKTRAAILKAALLEFSNEGVAGARTDEIARTAGVNKALLYYYFKDKEGLYSAVLEQVFTGLLSLTKEVLDRDDLAPAEKLILYVETHFNYIAHSPMFPRLMQREFMRAADRNEISEVNRIVEHYARPFYEKMMGLIAEGIRTGDFRKVDPAQTVTSIFGTIIFYFISIPSQRFTGAGDPFSAERIAARRAAVLDFISAGIFAPSSSHRGKRR